MTLFSSRSSGRFRSSFGFGDPLKFLTPRTAVARPDHMAVLVILLDTKFEFGLEDGRIILVDEALTPDSSRFWPKDGYKPGRSQESFDKQYVRDYLETLDWDKQPPGPGLPNEVITRTSEKYLEAHRLLTGDSVSDSGFRVLRLAGKDRGAPPQPEASNPQSEM